jgi:hypothetical protein
VGGHIVFDGRAVVGGQRIRCPRQQFINFLIHVGYDFGSECFPALGKICADSMTGLRFLGKHNAIAASLTGEGQYL